MYESFFQLRLKPFDLLSDPDFLFLGKSHRKALTYLDYALCERAGFMLLTGEIGSGKTTIIRELTRRHRDRIIPAKIFNTNITPDQLLAMVLDDFGITPEGKEKTALLRALYDFLIGQYARGTKPVLFIDEAQNLSHEALEEVRMLSNLESDKGKLLQVIMVGQPELKMKLAAPGLLQFRQRIGFSCHLGPLNHEEVKEYILHRLEIAGNREAAAFSAEALELIGDHSRGIPRLINIICDFLLLTAFSEETREIGGPLVREVLGELDFENQYWTESEQPAGDGHPILPPASAYSETLAARADEMKGLFAEVLSRVDALEKRETLPRQDGEADFNERLKQSDRTLREHMQATARRLDELGQAVKVGKSLRNEPPPLPEKAPERKRGVLAKLFRAV
jgi:general secretion pathway protein A